MKKVTIHFRLAFIALQFITTTFSTKGRYNYCKQRNLNIDRKSYF